MRNVFLQLVYTIKHVQLVWRHDSNLPTKRMKLERVLFSMNAAAILIHPHLWSANTYLCRQQRPSDTKDTATSNTRVMDDNDEIRAIEADHRTGGTKPSRAERIVVCCVELFCLIIRNNLYH